MDKLNFLSLVNRVCTTLDNHLGISDKVLAEFVIELCDSCEDISKFKDELMNKDAVFPDQLSEALFQMIRRVRPYKTKSTSFSGKGGTGGDGKDDSEQFLNSIFDGDNTEEKVDDFSSYEAIQKIKENTTKLKTAYPSLSMPDKSFDELKDDLLNKDVEIIKLKDDESSKSKKDDETTEKKRGRNNYEKYSRYSDEDDGDYRRGKNKSKHIDEKKLSKKEKKLLKKRQKELFINDIYEAEVQSLQPFGFFARLISTSDGIRLRLKNFKNQEGMCHITEIKAEGKVGSVADEVKRGQKVYLKVLSVVNTRVSLSMREVDQKTGKDLFPREKCRASKMKSKLMGKESESKGDLHPSVSGSNNQRSGRKLTAYELWERKQLKSGSTLATDIHIEDEIEDEENFEAAEEDFEIELNEEEPNFLKGQTAKTGHIYDAVQVIKAPEGSLQKAADSSSELAKERREMREQQRNSLVNSVPKDFNKPWEDPMAENNDRQLANEFRGLNEEDPILSKEIDKTDEWKKSTMSNLVSFGKITKLSIKQQRESLPIYHFRDQLVKAIADNSILVVIGETGSGKTTQITQYLAEEGFATTGIIGCTQPRRVAAVSVANRVAEEFGCRAGEEVGYTIRFEDNTSKDTKIKYMTDGMLLREILVDPLLKRYNVILLDEAHERNLHTDVLFGLLKKLTTLRKKDFKLIVTSATLDAEKFATYFYNCPIFKIPGRTYPVEILYTKEAESDYLDASLITVMQIHLTEPPGDILLFLTGQEEIDFACQTLYERMKSLGSDAPDLLILPIYSALPSEIQSRVFEPAPPGSRKVVIATNIAETSITIDGIYYVVDPGFVKQNVYNPKTSMEQLLVVPISKASANQRAGRAGRTGPGKAYRLYTEEAFNNEMLPTSVPEIQRTNLGNVVLMLKAMGINDLLGFDFMDPPPPQALVNAMEQLFSLGALDDEGLLTPLGRKMAEFPLEPQMSKTLIASVEFGCSDEVLTVVSMLSIQGVFYRPREKQALADQKRAKFFQPEGDHITLLEVYKSWKLSNYSNAWCFDNFIQARSIKRARDVRKQLLSIMDRYKLSVLSCGKKYIKIQKAFCSGYFAHAAKKDQQEGFKTIIDNQPVYMHPSSALFNNQPEFILYHTLVLTTKEYMRDTMVIDAKWLPELAPNFYKRGDPSKLTRRKKQEKIEPLWDRFNNDQAWRLSKRRKVK